MLLDKRISLINIIKQHIPKKIDGSTIKDLKTLGIDEISLKNGIKTSLSLSRQKKREK
jgi:hypothetical protein